MDRTRVGLCMPAVASCFLLLLQSMCILGQECEVNSGSDQQGPIYERIFHIMFSGRDGPAPTRDSMASLLANCGNIDDFAQEAIRYIEPYGINLEAAKRDPYAIYDNNQFYFGPLNMDPKGNSRIVSESLFNFAKFRNTPLMYVAWVFTAKTDLRKDGVTLPAGYIDAFGMYRFSAHGREFCVRYQTRTPTPNPYVNSRGPVDLTLYSDVWGEGSARGLFINNNGTYDFRYTMTFPADL